ncbi:MAG: 30S ribosomal protein S5 [Rickettsiales bacterium]
MSKNHSVNKQENQSDVKEAIVAVNRTAKVVKGGRRFGFSAVVVAGDGKGKVGYGLGKAKEVAEARAKASQEARKNMIRVPLKDSRTLFHDVEGHVGAGRVLLRAAKPGTGVIAGGPMRAVFEMLGIHDIVAKSMGSSNVHIMIKATFEAFSRIQTPKAVSEKRGKKISELAG